MKDFYSNSIIPIINFPISKEIQKPNNLIQI